MDSVSQDLSGIGGYMTGSHVLLVDHDTRSLNHVASLLRRFSYIVTTTMLANVALTLLCEHGDEFDAIIADSMLPDMEMFKFIESVQFLDPYMPIMMLSSTPLFGDNVVKALTEGVCYFFVKPVDEGELRNLRQLIYRERIQAERAKKRLQDSGNRRLIQPQNHESTGRWRGRETDDTGCSSSSCAGHVNGGLGQRAAEVHPYPTVGTNVSTLQSTNQFASSSQAQGPTGGGGDASNSSAVPPRSSDADTILEWQPETSLETVSGQELDESDSDSDSVTS